MRDLATKNGSRGFSLVELLVVVAMLGIVTMAVYSLFQSTQRSAYSQDEVVELQQNLRVGMDRVARDIRMAGFMTPSASTPISAAGQNSIAFQTASVFGEAARFNDAEDDYQIPSPVASTDDVPFTVASGDQAALFKIGNKVRIIRPPNQNNMFPTRDLEVVGVSPSASPPFIEIEGFDPSDAATQIRNGDIIARITSGSNNPNTIRYLRSDDQLSRRTDEGTGALETLPVAEGLRQSADPALDGLQFRYLLDDGTEATTVASADLDSIRAVRVTLIGEVNTTEGIKTRSLTSLINLRNR